MFMIMITIGMKVLLLDATTTKIVSMVYSQTQILEQEVYLVEQIGKRHEAMRHLKAAVFIQPTEANLELLIKELRDPKFAEYHIFFSNIVPHDMLARLGRADDHEVVRQVQEYYADYMAINEDFYQLGIDNSLSLSSTTRTLESGQIFDRNVQGILSSLLSFKRRPSQIRYQGTSDLARRVASDVVTQVERDDIFDFRRKEGPMLLILDRRDDPITPLLTQWTYQAMVHELLGLNHNRVVLKGAPGIKKDLEEVVLSATQDNFFAKHRFDNFGDLGAAVKDLLDEYQKSSKMNENISSIEDMQAFMERYPAFRSRSINVTKHVAIMSELGRLIDVCQLLDISSLEQEISCTNDHSTHKKDLMERISNPRVQPADKLRLALLYVIRYESYNEIREIKAKLLEKGLSTQQVSLLDCMVDYAGESKRAPGLFSQGSMIAKFTTVFSQSVTDVANVYTQHRPLLASILESIAKGKFKDSAFPCVLSNSQSIPSDIFVFIVGGVTYEEAAKVAAFNIDNPGMKVVLGGSCIQNSTSFLREIAMNFGNNASL
jgi:vacuolar protein sorting-associated protein 45